VARFIECRGCGFVLRGLDAASEAPKYWETCPDCGGTDFEFAR
jgi:rubredoxin